MIIHIITVMLQQTLYPCDPRSVCFVDKCGEVAMDSDVHKVFKTFSPFKT